MSTQTLTLADFLLARITEDEAIARECMKQDGFGPDIYAGQWPRLGHWRAEPSPGIGWVVWRGDGGGGSLTGGRDGVDARHAARHDPARVLAECEAKRLVVAYCSPPPHFDPALDPEHHFEYYGTSLVAERVLMFVAQPYIDHPDFREEWRADAH